MSDNISRKAVIDAIQKALQGWDGYALEDYRRGLYKAQDILEALPSADNWIPCSERLPEEYDEYLCQCDDGDMMVLWLENAEWCRKYVVEENIVAWTPLPEPYKGGAL